MRVPHSTVRFRRALLNPSLVSPVVTLSRSHIIQTIENLLRSDGSVYLVTFGKAAALSNPPFILMEKETVFEITDLPPSLTYAVGKNLLRPMTPEESQGYIVCMMMEGEASSPDPTLSEGYLNQKAAVEKTAIYQIMTNRLELVPKPFGDVASFSTIMLLCYLCKGNPGNAVLWAYTLKEMYRTTKKTITMDDISRPKTFGWGMPNAKGLQEVWDFQKGGMLTKELREKLKGQPVDNVLDLMFPWTTGLDAPTEVQHPEGE